MAIIKPAQYPWLDYRKYSFSLGRMTPVGAWLSGTTASHYNPQSRHVEVPRGMAAQVRMAYDKIEATLAAAGLDVTDITRITEYLPPEGIAAYAELRETRDALLKGHQPCISTVPVRRLLREGALVEIEVTTGSRHAEISSGLVHLPTILPLDARGNIVGAGDVVAQTEQIFKNAEKLAGSFGLDLSHAVMTCDYLRPEARKDYRPTGEVRREYLGPVYPGAAGIMQPALMHPDALVQYDITLSREMPVRIDPGWRRYDRLTYSAGVRAGRLVFPSGMGAMEPVSETFPYEGVVKQADYIYEMLAKIMEAAGGSLADIVKTIEFIPESSVSDYRGLTEVRKKHFGETLPAATGTVCGGLLRREMAIEVVSVAVLPPEPQA